MILYTILLTILFKFALDIIKIAETVLNKQVARKQMLFIRDIRDNIYYENADFVAEFDINFKELLHTKIL